MIEFLAGFGFCVMLLLLAFYYLLVTDDDTAPPERKFVLSFDERKVVENLDAYEENYSKESKDEWLNSVIQRIFTEVLHNPKFAQHLRKRIERTLNKAPAVATSKSPGSFKSMAISLLGRIQVKELNFGEHAPRVSRVCINDHGGADFYFRWSGSAKLHIETRVRMPLDTSRYLQVAAQVLIHHIEGPATFRIPSEINPVWTLSFVRRPTVEMDVKTEVGSSFSLANIPQIGAQIKKRVINQIEKQFVLSKGGGLCGRIPIKNVRKTKIMTVKRRQKLLAEGKEDIDEEEDPLSEEEEYVSFQANTPSSAASAPVIPQRPRTNSVGSAPSVTSSPSLPPSVPQRPKSVALASDPNTPPPVPSRLRPKSLQYQ